MPTQPEGTSDCTAETFLAKLETIPEKDIEHYVAWQPVLHYYFYINGDDAPDIEDLLAKAKETGWTAQVNSIKAYLNSSELMCNVSVVTERLFQKSIQYTQNKARFEALSDARWIGLSETDTDSEDLHSGPKRKKTIFIKVKMQDGKEFVAQSNPFMASLLQSYWTLRRPGHSLIERGKTSSVKTSQELFAFWGEAFNKHNIREAAQEYKAALICLLKTQIGG